MKEETINLMFAKTAAKENMVDEDDGSGRIPAEVQSFLWRLTSPFVQSKLTKQYEGSCVTLERILVDRRLSGLPPSLQSVISSVPSWSLLNAGLPHVMQGCAALLANRNSLGSSDRLRVAETKLLYTLHWILLWYSNVDDECENLETPWKGFLWTDACPDCHPSLQSVISSVPSWSLLNAGLPHVMQGCAALLANRNSLGSSDRLRVAETKLLYTLHWILLDAPHEWYSNVDDECENLETKLFPLETIRNFVHLFAPLVNCIRENDLTFRLSKGIRIWKPMWEHRQPEVSCFCVFIKPKFTASMEHVASDCATDAKNAQVQDICEVCRTSVQDCQCRTDKTNSGNLSSSNVLDVHFDQSWHNACKSNPEIPTSVQKQEEELSQEQDVSCATYFDVAVLQCLFKKHWSEDGVNWALQYVLQRLRSLLDAKLYQENRRRRSCSTPAGNIPTIEVTPSGQGTAPAAKDGKKQQSSLEGDSRRLSVPEGITKSPQFTRREVNGPNSQPKSGKEAAENLPSRQPRRSRRYGTTTCPWNLPLPIEEESSEEGSQKNSVSSDCAPTEIPLVIVEDSEMVTLGETPSKPSDQKQLVHQAGSDPFLGKTRRASAVQKGSDWNVTRNKETASKSHKGLTRFSSLPIGVTDKHESLAAECDNRTPPKRRASQSLSSELLVIKQGVQKSKSAGSPRQSPKITISRSATDTKINYNHMEEAEVCEVPGVACYIENDGKLSFDAIVHAIHQVVMSDSNLRISSIVLNIIDTLFDLEFIPLNQNELGNNSTTNATETDAQNKTKKEKKDSYAFLLDIVLRVIQSFSCPHGCSDGHRGSPGDIVRQQAQDCFTRLFQGNKAACTTHLQKWISGQPLATTVDFLHSWLGFCSFTPPSPFIPERRGSYYGQKSLSWTTAREDMEGIIIARCFKTLMKQILQAETELQKPGAMNCSLFFDVQQLMTYLKEFHGSTFRKILLTGLADATIRKQTSVQSQSASSGVLGAKDLGMGKGASGSDKTRKGHGRRDFFRRRFVKRSSSTSVSSSGSELEAFDNNGASAVKASSVNQNRQMSITSVGSISEDDGSTLFNKGKRRTFGLRIRLGSWRKSSRRRSRKFSQDPEEASEMQTFLPQPANKSTEKSVEYHLDHRRVGLRALANSQHLLARISRRRRGLMSEDKEESSDQHSSGPHSEPTSKGRPSGWESREKGVNADSTRDGMHIFRFLLNACQPGTVPDPELLAAMLYLVEERRSIVAPCPNVTEWLVSMDV
ncbi:protein unc-80 homolog [Branchiostoma floridae x Branchiostoma japonicum]